MENQKIANLLNESDNESSKFATRKWSIINDQSNVQYGIGNENDSTIKFETKVIKIHHDTKVAFKNCAPFRRCITHINDEHVETAENLDIIMLMYNLLEYSGNYSDTNGSLWQFKRD